MIRQRCQSSASSACRFFVPLLQQNRDSGVGFLGCWREPWNKLPPPQPPSKIWGGLAGQKCCKITDLNILFKKRGGKRPQRVIKKMRKLSPEFFNNWRADVNLSKEPEGGTVRCSADCWAIESLIQFCDNPVILWQLMVKFELHRLNVRQCNTPVWQNLQVPRNEVTKDRKFLYSVQNTCF